MAKKVAIPAKDERPWLPLSKGLPKSGTTIEARWVYPDGETFDGRCDVGPNRSFLRQGTQIELPFFPMYWREYNAPVPRKANEKPVRPQAVGSVSEKPRRKAKPEAPDPGPKARAGDRPTRRKTGKR